MRSVCNCEFVTFKVRQVCNVQHYIAFSKLLRWQSEWTYFSQLDLIPSSFGNHTALRLWRRSHTCWSMSDTYTVLRMLSSRWARLVRLFTRLLLVPLYPFFCYHMADTMDQHTSLKITHCGNQKRTKKSVALIAPRRPCFECTKSGRSRSGHRSSQHPQ